MYIYFKKMKKDYLEEGSMADTADLVVLGAYYGTGNKGIVYGNLHSDNSLQRRKVVRR